MDVLRLEAVEVAIGGRRILGPVSWRMRAGERWAILGPNGAGKTTLLALAGAQRQPTAGVVEVLGRRLGRTDVRNLRARIGHLGHTIAERLSPSMRVEHVVLTGKRSTLVTWFQELGDADRTEATRLLERVGCADLRDRPLATCSQGERQRVLLARALFGRPDLLLLDEPCAGLDLPGREALIAALDGAAGRTPAPPALLVTHRLEDVPASTTHAALLRAGRLTASGPIADVLRDDLLGDCFGIEVRVARTNGRWSTVARR